MGIDGEAGTHTSDLCSIHALSMYFMKWLKRTLLGMHARDGHRRIFPFSSAKRDIAFLGPMQARQYVVQSASTPDTPGATKQVWV